MSETRFTQKSILIVLNYLTPEKASRFYFSGQLKFIHQPEGEAGQQLEVRVCEAAGSSCSACADRAAGRARVCQQTYRRARLYVLGDNLRDLVLDTFSVPDGCRCVAES